MKDTTAIRILLISRDEIFLVVLWCAKNFIELRWSTTMLHDILLFHSNVLFSSTSDIFNLSLYYSKTSWIRVIAHLLIHVFIIVIRFILFCCSSYIIRCELFCWLLNQKMMPIRCTIDKWHIRKGRGWEKH